MKKKNKIQVFNSIFWIGSSVILNYMISFCITPFITENIGTEAYGFVTLAKNIANYATVLTVALNSFGARFISIEYHKENYEKANSYFSSIFYANVVLGAVLILLVIFPIYRLDHYLNIPLDIVRDVKILFLLDFINFMIMTIGNSFNAAAIINNRVDLTGKIKCLSYCSEALFLLGVFTLFRPKVMYVGLGLIVSSIVLVASNFAVTKKLTPKLKIRFRLFSLRAVKDLVINGIWNSINSLGNMMNHGIDLWITNTMLSPLEMGQLAIVKTISTIFSSLFSTISQPFQPLLIKAYATDDKQRLIRIFKDGIKMSGMFSNIAFAGFVSLGAVYYQLWTPSQDSALLHSITIVAVLGAIIEGAVYPLYYTYTLTLKNKVPCFVTLASGSINIIAMLIWIKFFDYGLYGVVTTTAILSWVVNFIFNPQYAAHCLHIKRFTFYPILFRHILSCIVMTFAFKFVTGFIYPSSWIGLIGTGALLFAIGVVIHMLCMFERNDYARIFKKYMRKNDTL